MPYTEIDCPQCFTNQLEPILKKFKKSAKSIKNTIDSIKDNPEAGSQIPGFDPPLMKLRLPLKEYNIGKSGG